MLLIIVADLEAFDMNQNALASHGLEGVCAVKWPPNHCVVDRKRSYDGQAEVTIDVFLPTAACVA